MKKIKKIAGCSTWLMLVLCARLAAAGSSSWTYYAANEPTGCGTNYARITDGT